MKYLTPLLCLLPLLCCGCSGCVDTKTPTSLSGVKEVRYEVKTGADGMTSEQRNIVARLKADNQPGAVKHLYVFSAYSGQCLLYSTVREKVTSSGKRLSPTTVNSVWYAGDNRGGVAFDLNGRTAYTQEMIQDDGTYGSSIEYLFWTDAAGKYHQHYLGGGQIVHVSDEPMPVKSITINVEAAGK